MSNVGDPCPNCKTPLLLAPGIGVFCPNSECPVSDGPDIWPATSKATQPDSRAKVILARFNTDKLVAVLGSSITLILVAAVAYGVGTVNGYNKGLLAGRDTVFCVMDRFTNSHPVGARGPSAYCKRVDADRDARR